VRNRHRERPPHQNIDQEPGAWDWLNQYDNDFAQPEDVWDEIEQQEDIANLAFEDAFEADVENAMWDSNMGIDLDGAHNVINEIKSPPPPPPPRHEPNFYILRCPTHKNFGCATCRLDFLNQELPEDQWPSVDNQPFDVQKQWRQELIEKYKLSI
jgi:hypothetical protein